MAKGRMTLRRLALVVALLGAATAAAQSPGGGRPGGTGGPGGMGGPGGIGGMGGAGAPRPPPEARLAGANIPELVQMRLGQLEEDLNLLPNQRMLWNTYRERVLRLLDDVRRAGRAAASEATAPQRLDALTDIARNRLTATEDIAEAGKALYAALTPAQREVADRRLALPLATLNGNDTGADLRMRGDIRQGGGDVRPGGDGGLPGAGPPK